MDAKQIFIMIGSIYILLCLFSCPRENICPLFSGLYLENKHDGGRSYDYHHQQQQGGDIFCLTKKNTSVGA